MLLKVLLCISLFTTSAFSLRLEPLVPTPEEWLSSPFCDFGTWVDGPITFFQGGWRQASIPSDSTLRSAWRHGDPLRDRLKWASSVRSSIDAAQDFQSKIGQNQRWWNHRYAGAYDVLDLAGVPGFEDKTIGVIHGETFNLGLKDGTCSTRYLLPSGFFDGGAYCPRPNLSNMGPFFAGMWPSYTAIASYAFSTKNSEEWGMMFDNVSNAPAIRPHGSYVEGTPSSPKRSTHGQRHPDAILMKKGNAWYVYVYYLEDRAKMPQVQVARAPFVRGDFVLRFEKWRDGVWIPQSSGPTTDLETFPASGVEGSPLSVGVASDPDFTPVQFQVARIISRDILVGFVTFQSRDAKRADIQYAFSQDGETWTALRQLPLAAKLLANSLHSNWNPLTLSNETWNNSNDLGETFFVSARIHSSKVPCRRNLSAVHLRVAP